MSFMDGDPVRFDQFAAHTAAFLLAALASALVLVFPLVTFWPLAFIITLAHAVVVALPLLFIFLGYSERWINGISATTSGFLIATLSAAWLLWPGCYKCSSSYNDVALVIDGVLTAAGWLSFGRQLLRVGLAGAFGGFVFWLTLKCCGLLPAIAPSESRQASHMRHNAAAFTALAVATLLTASVFAMVSLKDWARTLNL